MKIVDTMHMATATRSIAGGAPASTAFQDTLRDMERQMWQGAKAGHSMPARENSGAAHGTQARIPSPAQCTPAENSTPAQRTISHSFLDRKRPGAMTDANKPARREPPQARVSTDSASERVAALHSESRLHSAPVRMVRSEITHTPTSVAPGRLSPRASESDVATPWRATLLGNGAGISLVMRVKTTCQHELDALSHVTLDALRRSGIRPMRVVINGIDRPEIDTVAPVSSNIPGGQHGN